VATTGEIGLIKVTHESAIAAGTRRIEAVAGGAAHLGAQRAFATLEFVAARLGAAPGDLEKRLESVLAEKADLEKRLRAFAQKAAAGAADALAAAAVVRGPVKWVAAAVAADSQEALRALGAQVAGKLGPAVVILGAQLGEKAAVVAFCSPEAVQAGHQAGKLVQSISLQLGGKGGGKPDFAMGGGRDTAKLAAALAAV
jgi:alanyl-tRNA synthetase